ncbi:FAD-dependent oxidoreductase [Clostridium sp.]|jgi:2,4-dienoyl-CoA reductase-like NADH-dependent reductase (Old Yellow Enzyme family)/thioredoxin reductase|uniref:oxidoreductase n=1 Tax=Clostridium sp. TaxID=1506 RepID=UPI003A5C097C
MRKFNNYPNIFKPLQVGNMTIKNRITFSPLVSCHADADGRVTTELVDFLGAQARTGASVVTIGATAIDAEKGEDFLGALSITRDKDIMGLSRLAEEVHRYGCKLSVELNHAGRAALPDLLVGDALAPSSIPLPGKSKYVKELNQREIDDIINKFADCAYRCMVAGFDMVMLHGAHGNLIAQFLSPLTNKRTDWYGGSLENRMRFPLEVLKAIRAKCGNKLAIDFRISADECAPGGMKIDEVIKFLKVAQKYLDMVHVSRGLIVDLNYAKYTLPTYLSEHCVNAENAAKIKASLDIPVCVVGGITTLEEAEEILEKGQADVIAMARALLVDGETVTKGYRGQSDKIRPCIRCYNCLKSIFPGWQVRCSLNPVVGRETKYRTIQKSDIKKNVMIVGGGVAGMMAAETAVKRGHNVTIYEKSNRLGGLLHEASVLPFKKDLKRYLDWQVKNIENCGAKIVLNTEVTPELVEQVNPDALVICTGSTPIVPPIDGIDRENVISVFDADKGNVEIGDEVVICGGGLSGCESALALAQKGKKVTIVDMLPVESLCSEMFMVSKIELFDLLHEHNVKLIGNVKVDKINENGVEIIDRNWKKTLVKADTVVIALGMKPTIETVNKLSSIIPETYVVGDCSTVKDIHNAVHSAFNIAVEI